MTIRNVLVSLDGSRFAETALPVAARLARAAGARLRVAMVHEPAMALVPAADIPVTVGPDEVAMKAEEKSYLAGVTLDLGQVGGGPVEFTLLEGLAGPTLVAELERSAPDLFVMATHGRGPLSRFWLGSVADHVIRHTAVPVLLLHPKDGDPVPAAETRLERGLVSLDRSEEAEAVVAPLVALARVTQAHLTLINVVEPVLGISGAVPPYPVALPQETLETLRAEGQKYLDEVADRLRREGIGVATKVVVGLGIAGTILNELDQGKHDFVAMTTHGATGFKRLLLGSVADKVIRGSNRPTLVVRPAAQPGA